MSLSKTEDFKKEIEKIVRILDGKQVPPNRIAGLLAGTQASFVEAARSGVFHITDPSKDPYPKILDFRRSVYRLLHLPEEYAPPELSDKEREMHNQVWESVAELLRSASGVDHVASNSGWFAKNIRPHKDAATKICSAMAAILVDRGITAKMPTQEAEVNEPAAQKSGAATPREIILEHSLQKIIEAMLECGVETAKIKSAFSEARSNINLYRNLNKGAIASLQTKVFSAIGIDTVTYKKFLYDVELLGKSPAINSGNIATPENVKKYQRIAEVVLDSIKAIEWVREGIDGPDERIYARSVEGSPSYGILFSALDMAIKGLEAGRQCGHSLPF